MSPPSAASNTSQAVVGVDVGGTKIKAGVVARGPEDGTLQVIATEQLATPRTTPRLFYDLIAVLIRRVRERALRLGTSPLPIVSVAHPGRFLPDGTLARGTTPNLGRAPGQYDGINPSVELMQRIGGTVLAENDAVSQMRYGLDALLRDATARPRLLGETVVYLGPGTGMGGGVARVSAAGDVTPITDGHFFDLQLPAYGDGTLTAEELFTGPAIARRIGHAIEPPTAEQLNRVLEDAHAPAAQRSLAERLADQAGEVLAMIIETIHAGTITKVRLEHRQDGTIARHVDEPDRAWPSADRDAVRGTTRFLLGGSVGISKALGGRIRQRALERLRARGLAGVELFQIPVASADAGLLGAILAIQEVPGTLTLKVPGTLRDG